MLLLNMILESDVLPNPLLSNSTFKFVETSDLFSKCTKQLSSMNGTADGLMVF